MGPTTRTLVLPQTRHRAAALQAHQTLAREPRLTRVFQPCRADESATRSGGHNLGSRV